MNTLSESLPPGYRWRSQVTSISEEKAWVRIELHKKNRFFGSRAIARVTVPLVPQAQATSFGTLYSNQANLDMIEQAKKSMLEALPVTQ